VDVLIYTQGYGDNKLVSYIDFDDLLKIEISDLALTRNFRGTLEFEGPAWLTPRNGVKAAALSLESNRNTLYTRKFRGAEKLCLQVSYLEAFRFICDLLNFGGKIFGNGTERLRASGFWEKDEVEGLRVFADEYNDLCMKLGY
jgi:hypothetical protein